MCRDGHLLFILSAVCLVAKQSLAHLHLCSAPARRCLDVIATRRTASLFAACAGDGKQYSTLCWGGLSRLSERRNWKAYEAGEQAERGKALPCARAVLPLRGRIRLARRARRPGAVRRSGPAVAPPAWGAQADSPAGCRSRAGSAGCAAPGSPPLRPLCASPGPGPGL